MCFLVFFLFSFEVTVLLHTIHPFKGCDSVMFSVLSQWCIHQPIYFQSTFITPKRNPQTHEQFCFCNLLQYHLHGTYFRQDSWEAVLKDAEIDTTAPCWQFEYVCVLSTAD